MEKLFWYFRRPTLENALASFNRSIKMLNDVANYLATRNTQLIYARTEEEKRYNERMAAIKEEKAAVMTDMARALAVAAKLKKLIEE